jgi:hypothetical protein
MKPRLPSAPATDEDSRIWWVHHWIQPFKPFQLMTFSLQSDRDDADLMLALQQARRDCDEQGVLHCILAGHHTALAEFDDPDVSLSELGLAMRIPKLPERYR